MNKEISPNTTIPNIKIIFQSFQAEPRTINSGIGGWGVVTHLEKTMTVKVINTNKNEGIGHVYQRMQELSNTREVISDFLFEGVDDDPKKGVAFTGRVSHTTIWLTGYLGKHPYLEVIVDIIDIAPVDLFKESGKLDDGKTIHI